MLLLVGVLLVGCAVLAQPPGPEKWEPLSELTDEFDGDTLDAARWHPCNPGCLGRQPGYFLPDNVTVGDGMLHITMRREGREGLPEAKDLPSTFSIEYVRAWRLVE